MLYKANWLSDELKRFCFDEFLRFIFFFNSVLLFYFCCRFCSSLLNVKANLFLFWEFNCFPIIKLSAENGSPLERNKIDLSYCLCWIFSFSFSLSLTHISAPCYFYYFEFRRHSSWFLYYKCYKNKQTHIFHTELYIRLSFKLCI